MSGFITTLLFILLIPSCTPLSLPSRRLFLITSVFLSPPPPIEESCPSDAVVMETAVPGSYTSPCYTLPTRTISLPNAGSYTIIQAPTSGTTAGRTGVTLWNSSILLARLISSRTPLITSLFEDKDSLELGCGLGLGSIAASLISSSVIATDGNAEVLSLCSRNIKQRDNIKTLQLQWGTVDAADLNVDTAFGSDLTYNSNGWPALCSTLSQAVKPGGHFLYVLVGHSGYPADAEFISFLTFVEGMRDFKLDVEMTRRGNEELKKVIRDGEEKVLRETGGGPRVMILKKT